MILRLLITATLMFPTLVHADPSEFYWADRRDILVQTQSCIGESGWTDHESCIAMTYVHVYRAQRRGVRLATMARWYSSPLKTNERPWIRFLTARYTRPRFFPRHLAWSNHRTLQARMTRVVERTLIGHEVNPCPGAVHYGSRRLDSNPDPRKLEEHECLPNSGQFFFRYIEN